MASLNGFVKLHRKMLEWGWYSDETVKVVFLHLLLTANFKPGTFMGHEVKPGQVIVGRKKLAAELGLSERQIRTALDKLEKTKEISRKTTNKFTLITIENWAFYQGCDSDDDQQTTSERPTNDQQMTNKRPQLKNVKKVKKVKKIKKINNVQPQANELFETLWKLYPNKKGKGQVSDSKKREIFNVGFDEMSRAIQRYKRDLEKDADWRKPQNGSTFFNSGYVDYLDANYTPNDEGVSNNGQHEEIRRDNEPSEFGTLNITRF